MLILTLIILTSSARAEFGISKKNDRLLLQGDCAESKSIYASLARWNSNMKTGKTCKENPTTRSQDSNCNFDITDCVPDQVVKYHGANPKTDGPNCANLALVMSKILPSLRYSTPDEINFYMRPPLCRQLKDGENKEPGDVGTIREIQDGEVSESHSFIYISEKISYSKNGAEKDVAYQLQPLNKVFSSYDVPDRAECRKNEITDKSANCGQAVAYFRCQSMEEYLAKTKNIPKKIRAAFNRLDSLESCLESSEFSGKGLSKNAVSNIHDTSKALLAYMNQAKSTGELNKLSKSEKEFIIGSLQLRLQSIAEQMDMMVSDNYKGMSSALSEMINFTQSFDESAAELTK
jgi:hypothetical protein